MTCLLCGKAVKDEEEVITTHRALKGLFGGAPKVTSTSFVYNLIHVDCLLDGREIK